jgi:hypothetical protein
MENTKSPMFVITVRLASHSQIISPLHTFLKRHSWRFPTKSSFDKQRHTTNKALWPIHIYWSRRLDTLQNIWFSLAYWHESSIADPSFVSSRGWSSKIQVPSSNIHVCACKHACMYDILLNLLQSSNTQPPKEQRMKSNWTQDLHHLVKNISHRIA